MTTPAVYALFLLAGVVGVVLLVFVVCAVIGGSRKPSPPMPGHKPFSEETERAIAQNLDLFKDDQPRRQRPDTGRTP